MSSLASLPTLLVLITWPTAVALWTWLLLPSFFLMKVTTSALTSANTNGASYLNVSSPSLMALTGTGPQQYTPEGKCRSPHWWGFPSDKETCVVGCVTLVTFTFLLRCGVTGLPSVEVCFKVRPGHPVLHPAVIIPSGITHHQLRA